MLQLLTICLLLAPPPQAAVQLQALARGRRGRAEVAKRRKADVAKRRSQRRQPDATAAQSGVKIEIAAADPAAGVASGMSAAANESAAPMGQPLRMQCRMLCRP